MHQVHGYLPGDDNFTFYVYDFIFSMIIISTGTFKGKVIYAIESGTNLTPLEYGLKTTNVRFVVQLVGFD